MTATDLLYEQPSKLIRDLTDDEFEERYDCERFTATVLGSRYRYIVQHMCTGPAEQRVLVILRDWYDFAATISGPPEHEYSMPAMSNSLVLFIGHDDRRGAHPRSTSTARRTCTRATS